MGNLPYQLFDRLYLGICNAAYEVVIYNRPA